MAFTEKEVVKSKDHDGECVEVRLLAQRICTIERDMTETKDEVKTFFTKIDTLADAIIDLKTVMQDSITSQKLALATQKTEFARVEERNKLILKVASSVFGLIVVPILLFFLMKGVS